MNPVVVSMAGGCSRSSGESPVPQEGKDRKMRFESERRGCEPDSKPVMRRMRWSICVSHCFRLGVLPFEQEGGLVQFLSGGGFAVSMVGCMGFEHLSRLWGGQQ